jgi:spore photoproduct lyase
MHRRWTLNLKSSIVNNQSWVVWVLTISKIYIDQDLSDHPRVQSIRSRLNLPIELVQKSHEVFASVSAAQDPIKKGKEVLYLTQNKGAFIKNCPGTREYRCCDYHILHIGTFCHMDCSYCIMQSYFHPPVLQYFVNHEDLFSELDHLFARQSVCRIGTGEYTDSLIWDIWTDLSQELIPRFADQDFAILELKSKTSAIDKLKTLRHRRKTIASWSLNTPDVIGSEERSTATLSARLRAATRCETWGYPLAFHFDPMLIYNGCDEDYREIVHQIFSHVAAENIVWISLGTFRFMPSLKPIIQRRFPESKIVYGEFVPGLDGKMRYFKPLRIRLYQKMVTWLRECAPDAAIYLCMEDDEVWHKSLGFVPAEHGGLQRMLDESAVRHCGLDSSGLERRGEEKR